MDELNVATVSRNNDRWSLESLSKDRGQGGVFGFLKEKISFRQILKQMGGDFMKNNPFDRINNIPKIDLDYLKPIREQREHMNIVQKELEKAIAEVAKEREQYKQEVLQTLKNIETNTVGLNQIVPLLAQNNENQQQIIELLKQALEIAASQNEEEAKSKWRSFMDKLHQTISDVETIQKLQGFANIILAIFQNIKG